VWVVAVDGPAAAGKPLLNGPANEANATISPDGQWLAYKSDQSGRTEVYVRPFPAVDTGLFPISTDGGSRPAWSRDGSELFYYRPPGDEPGALMAAPIEARGGFSAGRPVKIFDWTYPALNSGRQSYDVSRDGERFLIIKAAEDGDVRTPQLVVVENWHQELRRLVPVP
jgi:serine/threonine-protein kinase